MNNRQPKLLNPKPSSYVWAECPLCDKEIWDDPFRWTNHHVREYGHQVIIHREEQETWGLSPETEKL